jgi:16S rRNA (cytidine1402-2'-O)-methyltransferase
MLIPTPLASVDPSTFLPLETRETIMHLRTFFVERRKSAERFLSRCGVDPGACTLVPLDDATPQSLIDATLEQALSGEDIGVLSEAGCPGIADPGAATVRSAHAHGIRVKPLVGPSAVLLAVMASGFNGQSFSFHGYLPAERGLRVESIRRIEKEALRSGYTQIFIEAPHRNDHLLHDLIRTCGASTRICVAIELTQPDERVIAMPVASWRGAGIVVGKKPAVFLLER